MGCSSCVYCILHTIYNILPIIQYIMYYALCSTYYITTVYYVLITCTASTETPNASVWGVTAVFPHLAAKVTPTLAALQKQLYKNKKSSNLGHTPHIAHGT